MSAWAHRGATGNVRALYLLLRHWPDTGRTPAVDSRRPGRPQRPPSGFAAFRASSPSSHLVPAWQSGREQRRRELTETAERAWKTT